MAILSFIAKIFDALLAIVRADMTSEEVEACLQARADTSEEKLDWRNSVVDLLKLIDLPSGFDERAALADELGIPDYTGTAGQNVEMHDRLLNQIAARNIKFPGRC